MPNVIFDFLGFLIVFGSVLFLAYVTTKYVGKNVARNMKGRNMEVIETLKLSVDKQLYIVRAGDKYILLSSTGKNIQLLSELNLDEDSIKVQTEQEPGANEFKAILEKYILPLKPDEGFFRRKSYTRKNMEMGQTDFANNVKKLQIINKKIDSEDVGHDK